jgi:hypothetical protein
VENEARGRGGLNLENSQILDIQGKKNENCNKPSQVDKRVLRERGK